MQRNTEQFKQEFREFEKEYFRVLEVDHDAITALKNKQNILVREIEDHKGFHEMTTGKIEKLLYKINSVNDKL